MLLDFSNPLLLTAGETNAAAGNPAPSTNTPSAHVVLQRLLQVAVPITYIAGVFPARSETFVYREVRELRRRGWNVTAASLHETSTIGSQELEDLSRGRLVVYGDGSWQTIAGSINELANHPVRTIRTICTAIVDAISPGEPMDWKQRLKLIVQAGAGIGLAGRLRSNGTRHIHCHFAHAPTTIGMYAARQLGVPFSFTGHANDLFHRRALLKRKLERASFVACISRWHRDFYRQLSPADDSVYPIVRCGVDVKTWIGTETAKAGASQPLRVLSVCRLVEKKGADSLIRAIAQPIVAGQIPRNPWTLTIAGDGPELQNLQRLVWELNLGQRVEFLGAIGNDRVRELLKTVDIFALACRPDSAGDRDGIPVVLMEAMACGVPVISGDLPAIRELIEPGVSGLLVNAAEPTALADAIEKLSNNADLRARLAIGGRTVIEREFDLNLNVTRLEQLVEKSMERGSRSTRN